MTKKQKWKYFFKYFGIGAAVAFGIVGLVCAYLGITGGFNKKVVEPESINFSVNSDKYQPDTSLTEPIYVINDDFYMSVVPTPEDSTELDATLTVQNGSALIKDILVKDKTKKDDKQDDSTAGGEQPQGDAETPTEEAKYAGYISAKIEDEVNKYQITIGEEFILVLSDEHNSQSNRVIQFLVEHEQVFCKAKVFVDSKVTDYFLDYQKINNPETKQNIFPGDSLYVSVDDNSLANRYSVTMSNLSKLTSLYKSMEFFIDNTDIAEIEKIEFVNGKPKAKVNVKKSGKFVVTAYLCDSYLNEQYILTDAEISALNPDQRDDYNAMLYGGYNSNHEEVIGFMKKATMEFNSLDIQIDSISSTKKDLYCNLFETYRYSADELELVVNPQALAGSPYSDGNLKYLRNEVEINAGYFVQTEEAGAIGLVGTNGEMKYAVLSNKYIDVVKGADASNNAIWTITIKDFYSSIEPSNCLILSLTFDTVKIDDDGKEQGEESKTVYTYVPLRIIKNDVPNYAIKIDNDYSQNINLIYDNALQEQTDIFDLSNVKFVLIDDDKNVILPESELKNSNSSYKTVLFATKNEFADDKFVFSNDIIDVTNALLDAEKGSKIIPKGAGTAYIYALVVKTNKDGKIVNSENEVIDLTAGADIMNQLVIEHYSDFIIVNVYQELQILSPDVVTLYYQEGSTYVEIHDDNDSYEIHRSASTGEIESVKIFNKDKLFVKLNVNDADAYKNAVDSGEVTFTVSRNIVSIGNLIQDGDTWLLPITAIDVLEGGSSDSLVIRKNGLVQYTLSIITRDYTLEGIKLSTGDVDSASTSAEVNLVLENNTNTCYWTTDTGKATEKPLEVISQILPKKARLVGSINYIVYEFVDNVELPSEITKDFIDNHLTPSDKVIKIKDGYPIQNENQNDQLVFDIVKNGKAVIIASYQLNETTTIYSNAFVVTVNYPNLDEKEYNYGATNNEVYEGEKYNIITTSYDDQIVDLLNFVGSEIESAGENTSKFGLEWYYSTETAKFSLDPSLYEFEIVSIDGSQNILKDNFSFVYKNKTQYLVVPKVDTEQEVYIKIKITTKFGYELSQTYNYKLVADFKAEHQEIVASAGDIINLFKLKYDLDQKTIVSEGNLFITNNYANSSYRYGNDEKLNGFVVDNPVGLEGRKILVVYLPEGYDKEANIENFGSLTVVNASENQNLYKDDADNLFEFRSVLKFFPQSNENGYLNADSQIESGKITVSDTVSTSFESSVLVWASYNDGETTEVICQFVIKIDVA